MIRRTIALVTVIAPLCGCASRGDFFRTHYFIFVPVYAAPHGQMFSMTAAVLQAEGYTVQRRDSAETEGWLRTEPRFTAPPCLKPEVRAEVEQLGLGLTITARTARKHDSTEVRILPIAVLRNPIAAAQRNRAEELEFSLRACGSAMVLARLESLAGRPTK